MGDADLHTAAQALLDATCPVRGICPLCSTGGFAHADGCEWKALRAALAAATEPPHRLNAGERMTVTALLERVDAWVESVEGTPAPWALVGDMADFLRRLADGPVPDPQGADESTPDAIGQAAARYADHIAAGTWPFQSCPEFCSAPGQGGHPCPGCPLPRERMTFEAARLAAAVGAPDEPTDDDTRPAARTHRAATGHEMAIVSAAASSCAECDWPVHAADGSATGRDPMGALAFLRYAELPITDEMRERAYRDVLAEVERLRAAATASEDEWEVFTASDGESALRMKASGSPPPTPAPTEGLIRRAEAADAERDAALDALAALAQSDREPLWRGKTIRSSNHWPDRSWLPEVDDMLPVPPGTAVRVDKDTGS